MFEYVQEDHDALKEKGVVASALGAGGNDDSSDEEEDGEEIKRLQEKLKKAGMGNKVADASESQLVTDDSEGKKDK